MSQIVSSEILENYLGNGDSSRWVRYQYLVEDNNANTQVIKIGPFRVPPDFNVESDLINRQTDVLDNEIELEKRLFEEDIRNMRNPFANITLKHHTRAMMLNHILRMFLSERLPINVLILGAEFLDRVTDAELKNVLNINDAKVTEIRNWQTKFKTYKNELDTYVPPLEVS